MVDVIVIGGGPAGVTAALRARELGARVALIERGALGGACLHDGCVPMRVLAQAARWMRDAARFADYGLRAPLPAVDFAQLLAQARARAAAVAAKKALAAQLNDAGVRVHAHAGTARFVDDATLALEDGTQLQARCFILCPGVHPQPPDFAGGRDVLTLPTLWTLPALPEHLTVLGEGASGVQIASIFAALGAQVTLLASGPRLLPREDLQLAGTMAHALSARGIEVVTGVTEVVSLASENGGQVLTYRLNGETLTLRTTHAISLMGWRAEVAGLNLDGVHVTTEAGYIAVDSFLRTSAPHIYAAGDVTGRRMLVQTASHEGRVAAENAVLGANLRRADTLIPHGGFTDPEYAAVGLTEAEARRVERDCLVGTITYADLDRAVIDGVPTGFCKLIVSQASHRILGAHIVGTGALEAIQLVTTAMAADLWVDQLAELAPAYPTYSAGVCLAARQVLQAQGIAPAASMWQALGTAPVRTHTPAPRSSS